MALDPQARLVLDLIVKAGRPAYDTLSPKEARQLFRETRPASTPTPPELGAVRNVPAEGPAGVIPLRLYRPKGVAETTALPVFVYFHGGGWVIGDDDFRDFTFANAVRFWGEVNPDFFKGTVVEKAAADVLCNGA